VDGIFTVQQLLERHREYNIETHLLFIDYVKAFDSVSQKIMGTNGRNGPSNTFNKNSGKYVPKYNCDYKER
jgi:hypothetical protein